MACETSTTDQHRALREIAHEEYGLEVRGHTTAAELRRRVVEHAVALADARQGDVTGLLYVARRKDAETYAEELGRRGVCTVMRIEADRTTVFSTDLGYRTLPRRPAPTPECRADGRPPRGFPIMPRCRSHLSWQRCR